MDAAMLLRREQHSRITRMHRKREHLAADGGDVSRVVERAEVGEQFLRVREAWFIGRFKPAELPQIFDTGGSEGQYDFGQVEPFDFGQFLNQPMSMFFPRPKPHANARRGAARPARALVGG